MSKTRKVVSTTNISINIDKIPKDKIVKVEEYHGYTECRYCQRPMSHNVKVDGEFKVIYVKCGCSRS